MMRLPYDWLYPLAQIGYFFIKCIIGFAIYSGLKVLAKFKNYGSKSC